jgi:predicted amidohydrolase
MPKLALIQHRCTDNTANNLAAIEKKIAVAAQGGAQLVLLQELHNSLYFCQSENSKQFDLAEPIPGPSCDRLGKLAAQHKIVIVSSLFEKRAKGLYHNTAVVFETDGSIAGIYRKMHIPDDPGYYEKYYFTPGGKTRRTGMLGSMVSGSRAFNGAQRCRHFIVPNRYWLGSNGQQRRTTTTSTGVDNHSAQPRYCQWIICSGL